MGGGGKPEQGVAVKQQYQTHLLVEFEPCRETLCILVLESKVPNLPQTNSLNNLKT